MAFSRAFMVAIHFLLLLLITLSCSSSSANQHRMLVVADSMSLIKRVCSGTRAPDTCEKCMYSDPRSKDASGVGLAWIAIDCAISSADFLQENMSSLASTAPDASTKEALAECSDWFSCARSQLEAAKLCMRTGKDEVATLALLAAGVYRRSCTWRLQRNNVSTIQTEQLLLAYDEFVEVASRIILE